jgi:acyl carrier protein
MTNDNDTAAIRERVIRVITGVLSLDESEIANLLTLSGYKKLKKWTSARHAEIIVAVEDEFGIEVDERSIPKLVDVAQITAYVRQRRA